MVKTKKEDLNQFLIPRLNTIYETLQVNFLLIDFGSFHTIRFVI